MDPVITTNVALFNEDCITGAKKHIPSNSVDLIITDPPYGINGDKLHQHYNRNEDFVVDGYVEIPEQEYGEFSLKWIKEAERILKPGGSIYIVSGYTNLYHILHALKQTKLEEINHIIWKYNFGVFTKRKYVSSHYHILYYEKPGNRRIFNLDCRFGIKESGDNGGSANYQDREDVWILNREYKPGQVKNKNELPTELLIKMMQYSSREGDLVCDLFLGGFSTAYVAIGLNRRVCGFEISEGIFKTRIDDIKSLLPGFLLHKLRKPIITEIENQHKPWTDNELDALKNRFHELQSSGLSKKETIDILEGELGRGKWSLEKALKKLGVKTITFGRPRNVRPQKSKPVSLSDFLK